MMLYEGNQNNHAKDANNHAREYPVTSGGRVSFVDIRATVAANKLEIVRVKAHFVSPSSIYPK
jgi:hypothetical protein